METTKKNSHQKSDPFNESAKRATYIQLVKKLHRARPVREREVEAAESFADLAAAAGRAMGLNRLLVGALAADGQFPSEEWADVVEISDNTSSELRALLRDMARVLVARGVLTREMLPQHLQHALPDTKELGAVFGEVAL